MYASINLFIYGKTYLVKRTTIYPNTHCISDYREVEKMNSDTPQFLSEAKKLSLLLLQNIL